MTAQTIDYTEITESPGLQATEEQVQRLYQRYHFATKYIKGGDVLEVACGTGIGLGYLAGFARNVIGIDIDDNNLKIARSNYKSNEKIFLQNMDAHGLTFPGNEFDLILLYEAIYYLLEPAKCISEIRNVLRDNGVFILCTVNKEWADFHPSPYTHKYYSSSELRDFLEPYFKEVTLFGAFPVNHTGVRAKFISFFKRAAVKFNLIPGSLKLRAYLKRIFIGKLAALPSEVFGGMTNYEEPQKIISDMPNKDYKILYAVCFK